MQSGHLMLGGGAWEGIQLIKAFLQAVMHGLSKLRRAMTRVGMVHLGNHQQFRVTEE